MTARPVMNGTPLTTDFARGSSPLTEKEAFGHVADKLGEVIDGLRALAKRQPLKRHPGRRLNLRQTFGFVAEQFTLLRDSIRAVALLRGHERWLGIAQQVEGLRDGFLKIDSTPLLAWPEGQLLHIADKLALVRHIVSRMRDRPATDMAGRRMTRNLILPN